MTLYRANPGDGIAWVTGASTGIGRELALRLAKAGYVVAATARSADKLESLAREAASAGGRIVAWPCDVTDEAAMTMLVDSIERDTGPIALAVFNAGNYWPARGEALVVENFRKTYDINLFGVLNGLAPLSKRMRARGRGHMAVVASISAYGGLPSASAYGASKAAVINMAEALKFDFDKMNIRLQVISPGFVETPLTDKNDFAMPALMKVGDAVDRIITGLRSDAFEITFPRRLSWTLKALQFLPYSVYFALVRRGTGWNKRPLKPDAD